MPAFYRRDLAVRTGPAGLDPLRAYCNLAQALFDPQLLREWERALERAFGPGLGGASLAQLLELNSELRRRAQLRAEDAQRMVRQMVEAASTRAERRTVARRVRLHGARARARRASPKPGTPRAHDDLRAFVRTLRELPLRLLEASLIWPLTDAERARWLAFWRRLAGGRPRREPTPQPRFDVIVRPAQVPREVRVAAARKLRAALLEALRARADAPARLTAHTQRG